MEFTRTERRPVTLAEMRCASVRYGDGRVVRLPDVRLVAGERVAVVGANGTGKTSLLRALARLDPAHADVGGVASVHVDARDVAFVPARPYLLRGDVLSNVELPLVARGVRRAERRTRAFAVLEEMGAAALASRPRSGLSDGEVQRVALARALVTGPRLLLLDEVLASLDAAGASALAAALRAREDLAVVAAAPAEPVLPPLAGVRPLRTGGIA